MLSYEWYSRTLRRYCKELAIPLIGTHGLRHSTSTLYLSHGATLFGVAVRYNVTDFLQLHAGYGSLSATTVDPSSGGTVSVSSSAYGAGARLFMPGWSFSPFFGFNYSKWSATGNVTLNGQTIDAGSGLPAVLYLTFGLDWQTSGGFNLGFGGHYLLAPSQLTASLQFVPQIYIGWFF